MSVQTQIDRISGNVSAALSAIAGKGVTVPDGSTSDALAELIASIKAGEGAEVSTGNFKLNFDFNIYNTDGYSISHGLSASPEIFVLLMQHEGGLAGGLKYYVYYKYMKDGRAVYGGIRSDGYAALNYITPNITAETVTIISDNSRITALKNNGTYVWVAVRGVP